MADLTVVQALNAVMLDVQGVRKGDRNQQQGFNFRGIDAVMNAVGPAFRQHGVICLPATEDERWDTYTTSKQTVMQSCKLKVRFVFHGPAGDTVESVVWGEASDAGDKATSKAHSVAYRTALLQALCIPTDEPDPDLQSHERGQPPAAAPAGPTEARPMSQENVQRFIERCQTHGVNPATAIERATDGRTNDPRDLLVADVSGLREAVEALSVLEPA